MTAQRKDYELFFDMVDKDHSGTLSHDELGKALQAKGFTKNQVEDMFRHMDKDNSMSVSKTEFLQYMGVIPEEEHEDAYLRGVFRMFDKNASGTINKDELEKVFKETKRNLSSEEIDRLIKLADKSGDGELDYEELIKMLKHV